MKKFLPAVLAAMAIASPALAAPVFTATLEKPVAKPGTTLAGGVIWRCLGNTCATASDISSTDARSACRKLVKELGPVSAFAAPKGALEGADLAACNG